MALDTVQELIRQGTSRGINTGKSVIEQLAQGLGEAVPADMFSPERVQRSLIGNMALSNPQLAPLILGLGANLPSGIFGSGERGQTAPIPPTPQNPEPELSDVLPRPQTSAQQQGPANLSFPLPGGVPPVLQPPVQGPDFSAAEGLLNQAGPVRPEPITNQELLMLALAEGAQGSLVGGSTGRTIAGAGAGVARGVLGGRAANRAAQREFQEKQAQFLQSRARFALEKEKVANEFQLKNAEITYRNQQSEREFKLQELAKMQPQFQVADNQLLMFTTSRDENGNLTRHVEAVTLDKTVDAARQAQAAANFATASGKAGGGLMTLIGMEDAIKSLPPMIQAPLMLATEKVIFNPNDPDVRRLREKVIEEQFGGMAGFTGVANQKPLETNTLLNQRIAFELLEEQGLGLTPTVLGKGVADR